jgi:hypothetical protein
MMDMTILRKYCTCNHTTNIQVNYCSGWDANAGKPNLQEAIQHRLIKKELRIELIKPSLLLQTSSITNLVLLMSYKGNENLY